MAAGAGRVTVEGGPELSKAFRRMADRVEDWDAVNIDAAEIVLSRALSLVPVQSGDLRASLAIVETSHGASVVASEPYAGVMHFGWRARNIEPDPYLWDALDDRRDAVEKRYRDEVGNQVKRFDREAPR